MLENFDVIHDNYKVELQIHVAIFVSCFYITSLWGFGIGHFIENFSSDLRKNDEIVRNCVSKLYSGYISPLPTPTTSAPHYHRALPLVNPHHQYE